jgi:hypothetical protein
MNHHHSDLRRSNGLEEAAVLYMEVAVALVLCSKNFHQSYTHEVY